MIAPAELAQMARRFQAAETSDARVSLLVRDGLRLLEDRLAISRKLEAAEEELEHGVEELRRAWEETAEANRGLAVAKLTIGKLGAELEKAAREIAALRAGGGA